MNDLKMCLNFNAIYVFFQLKINGMAMESNLSGYIVNICCCDILSRTDGGKSGESEFNILV
jgi:hypothetical protein